MQSVAEDVHMFVKTLNRIKGVDNTLPCPKSWDTEVEGIANSSELWFGVKVGGFDVMDINVMEKKDLTLYSPDPILALLYRLTCLSLAEQFPYVKFSTTEDFSEAVNIYEDLLGSISKNACESLYLKERR